jgi:hypothetical protein
MTATTRHVVSGVERWTAITAQNASPA